MSKRAAIPVLQTGTPVDAFAVAVKQNLDRITGQLRNEPPLPALPETATVDELRAAYNALLARVQGTAETQQPAALPTTELGAVLALIDVARFRAETADHRSAQALQQAGQQTRAGFALRSRPDAGGQTLDVVPEQLVLAILPFLPRATPARAALAPNDAQHILANRIFGAR